MANVFTASGNVIPASGNINFNSNAASNAVRQVFGELTSNMVGLVGSNVDDGTRPPPFTAGTVPNAASGNLKLSYFRGKSLFITPAPSSLRITNFTTSAVTLQWTLGSVLSTTLYIAVGTSAGASNTLGWTSATGGTAVSGTFANNTNYYVSIYGSNDNGTASLAVSNASAFIIPTAPTFSSASISNTTFTAVATSVTSGADISYTISPSAGVNNVSAGVFNGLTPGTQYTVTATATMSNAGAGYSSNSTASSTIYCLAKPKLTTALFGVSNVNVFWNGISAGTTSITVFNVNSGLTNIRANDSTAHVWVYSATGHSATTFAYTSLSSNVITAVGTNTSASASVFFIWVNSGDTTTVTLTNAKFYYSCRGGNGGYGVTPVDTIVPPYGTPGVGAYGTGNSTLTSGAYLALYAGRNGLNGSYTLYNNAACNYCTPVVNCGDGSRGGNGGSGAADIAIYSGQGGCAGGGGSASQILVVGTNYMIVAGGGGGGGGSGTGQAGEGGNGAAGGAAAGGQGNSYYGNIYDGGNGGGYYGGYGGSAGAGGSSGSGLSGNYSAGTAGTSLSSTITNNGSTSGRGGSANRYFGSVGGGGGGGYGGGGGGVSRNYNNSIDSGGGGAGGSYSSDGSATWYQSDYTPSISVVWFV